MMARARGLGPVVLVGLLFVLPVALAHPGPGWTLDEHHGWVHDHPDVGVSPSLGLFPGHADVTARLDALAEHPWMSVHELGVSGEGRPIRVVEVIHPDGGLPVEERVVTLLLTQQHGNEPAGTPAALRLLDEIAEGGALAETLRNQVLLVLPMANPDGAEAAQRGNADGTDTNRDHNHLETFEGDAMHRLLSKWPVHVALDHHEYGGTGIGNPFPVRLYDFDLTTLYPTHATVHPDVLLMAKNLMYDAIWPRAEENGYTVNEYGVLTLHGIPVEQLAGGPDPGILRNHWGLHHIAGILIESRIDTHPNPFHDAARREHIQYGTMTATLEYVSEHASLFIAAQEAAKRDHALNAPERYREAPDTAGAPLPPAYLVVAAEAAWGLLDRHGLPGGTNTTAGLVHDTEHAWPVHAAALFDAASSRRVLDGTPTQRVAVAAEEPPLAEDAPASVAILLVLAVALLALAARAPRRRP